MALAVVTGPGLAFIEPPSKSEPKPIVKKPQLPPIMESQVLQPPPYLSQPSSLTSVMINEMPPYMQSRYDYQPSPSFLRNSDISRNASSQKVLVQSSFENEISVTKQLFFIFFGMVLTGIPLAVITTFYLQQQGPCSTTTTVTTTTSTTTTTTWVLPSQCSTYSILNDSTRSVTAGAGALCDNALAAGWYRVIGGGTMLATTYISRNTCTTWYGGSYNGTIPSTPGATAYGTLCANNNGYVCYSSFSGSVIVVTNCNSYYVFYLTPITTCNSRYCTTP